MTEKKERAFQKEAGAMTISEQPLGVISSFWELFGEPSQDLFKFHSIVSD